MKGEELYMLGIGCGGKYYDMNEGEDMARVKKSYVNISLGEHYPFFFSLHYLR